MAGAAVTLTDLPHVTPLTRHNVTLNEHSTPIVPQVVDFMWGTDPAAAGLNKPWDLVVAADVLVSK